MHEQFAPQFLIQFAQKIKSNTNRKLLRNLLGRDASHDLWAYMFILHYTDADGLIECMFPMESKMHSEIMAIIIDKVGQVFSAIVLEYALHDGSVVNEFASLISRQHSKGNLIFDI